MQREWLVPLRGAVGGFMGGRMRLCITFLCGLFLLPGCAGEDGRGYPSLAKRAVENADVDNAPVTESKAAPDEGDVAKNMAFSRRLEDLSARVKGADTLFELALAENAQRVRAARNAAVLSENWVLAHIALGKIEKARSGSLIALAELDRLYADRLGVIYDGKAPGGTAELETAIASASALVDRQNSEIDKLQAMLQQP